jgi:sugar phosphate isomerase/epimerase
MLLVSTSSLSGYGLHRIFSFVKKAGYDGIDLVLTKQNYDTWSADYIKSLIDEF